MTEVTIDQGTLRGAVVSNDNSNKYYKFQGIPYAKPPLGSLRFKAPEPPEKWPGILDATQEGSPCYSRHPFVKNKLVGSENCLFLNVYTKKIQNGARLRPVMFWIHGGDFVNGCGGTELYGPDFLLDENVVVVTVNYRLGIFGFLCLEDPSLGVPGNAGLKDIVMALRWVQRNIAHFGGDPTNVTIFGQSAGAVAVHLLLLSEMGRGLFHKAIAQSGCAFNPWARGARGVKEIVALLGLKKWSEKQVYDFLLTLSQESLLGIQEEISNNTSANVNRAFAYVVENNPYEPAFLDCEPLLIIIGYTSAEMICMQLYRKPNWPGSDTLEDAIPWDWGYKTGSRESLAVADEIRRFYFGDKKLGDIATEDKVPVANDANIIYGIVSTTLMQYSRSKYPIYFYKISIVSELNIMRQVFSIQMPGVVHADDIGYLFKNVVTPEIKPGSLEEIAMRRFARLWTNFAKYGNPTPFTDDALLDVVWKPVTNDKLDYLDIGERLMMLRNPAELRRIDFLKNLFGRSPAGRKFATHL